jgi:hypothetical protein
LCIYDGEPMENVQELLRRLLLPQPKRVDASGAILEFDDSTLGASIVLDTFFSTTSHEVMVLAPHDPDGSHARKGEPYLRWPRTAVPLSEFIKASHANEQYFATVLHFMATVNF